MPSGADRRLYWTAGITVLVLDVITKYWAERELLRAAPELEALYLQGLATEGALASSFGPREMARKVLREQNRTVVNP